MDRLFNSVMRRAILSRISRVCSSYYNFLLFFLFTLFILRPYDKGPVYHIIWKTILTGVILSAVYNCYHNRVIRIIASILGLFVGVGIWLVWAETYNYPVIINTFLTILFLSICTGSIIYDVVLKARVTMETLKGVVCAYFMVAFVFAYLYYLIEYLIPGSFEFTTRIVPLHFFSRYLSEMLYFSFVTLLAIGYGDISAVKNVAQTAAVIEGIFGQFYIAILVSRLVGVYSFYSNTKLVQKLEKELSKAKEMTEHDSN